MTSTTAGPPSGDDLDAEPGTARTGSSDAALVGQALTGLDLLAGGAVLLVALVAWASLALAHLGRHSLPGVAVLTLAGVAVGGLVLRLLRQRVRLRADWPGVAVAVGCAAVAAALTFPGFSYGVADKDPGGYVSHAVQIARTGDYAFTDPILHDKLPVQYASPGARLPGVWVKDAATGRMVPQFYHLWPALLATAYGIDGYDGLRFAVPLMGVLAVLLMVALLRRVGDAVGGRAAGLVAAGAGGLLLATNMLEVWQARYPTTEVLTEALYLGSLLGIVIALQSRWSPAAGIAGLLVGIGWLNRADGLLLVLLSVGVGAALVATRRWDGRATWFAAGLAVVVPHALLQAYDLAKTYSQANQLPTLPKVIGLAAGCFVLAAVLRLVASRPLTWVLARLERVRVQQVLGLLVCAGALLLLAVGFLRPRLFGVDYFLYNGRRIRSYDELILRRLSWFITLPGFAVMGLGLAAVALRRWRAVAWAVVLPTLVLFPIYAYSARNSTRLMWWTRRYVPSVLPGIVILIALAVAVAFVLRIRGRALLRVPALLAAAGLVAAFLGQSIPLRRHDEWKGSFQLTAQISALAGGDRGVFLWEPISDQGCCSGPTQLLATPVWLARGELSAFLPLAKENRAPIIARYAKHFAGDPVFIVGDTPQVPAGIDPATLVPVMYKKVELPMWDESDTARPAQAHRVPVSVSVWRVRGT